MQVAPQTQSKSPLFKLSTLQKWPRWLRWAANINTDKITYLQNDLGQRVDISCIRPLVFQATHISWSPDNEHVSFLANQSNLWLVGRNCKQKELLAVVPPEAVSSLQCTWSLQSQGNSFQFSYTQHEEQLIRRFDVTERHLMVE